MHQDTLLLASITMALVAAFAGGLVARRLGLPAIVGYLLGGVAIGPFTSGFVGNSADMSQLAEIGVIFMMFGVGLHFSLRDLWDMRRIAIPGAILQMLIGTALGAGLAHLWGWSTSAGIVLGISISIASTVVLLRALTDAGLLQSPGGKVATAWLILEDLATVIVLVLLPVLFSPNGVTGTALAVGIGGALLKTAAFVALMLFVGARMMPWLLERIAKSRSRELFVLAVIALALGTAFGAADIFGVSLALGAFLAGVVISESGPGHQVAAEVLPFQDIFSILFFVSVGMLVDPLVLVEKWPMVLALTALIVVGKWLINMLLGLVLPSTIGVSLVVAAGLSQIGEFSFIVGTAGLSLGVLAPDQYSLILDAAVLSIVLNPLVFRVTPHIQKWMESKPTLRRIFERRASVIEVAPEVLTDHVVIIGYGRAGGYTARILEEIGEPYLIIESDLSIVERIAEEGVPVLFGDASNSEILRHAGLERASALVVTGVDDAAGQLIIGHAHAAAPSLPIIARANTQAGVVALLEHGAHHVVQPELEGGLEIMRHTLLDLGKAPGQIQQYADAVRQNAYSAVSSRRQRPHALDQLITAIRGVEVQWSSIEPESEVVGMTLANANVRATCGASIVAIVRNGEIMANPKSNTVLEEGDLIGVIGSPQEIAEACRIFTPSCEIPDDGSLPVCPI